MSEIARFSVSLEEELLGRFDAWCAREAYPTRSEAVRHLLHEKLAQQAWLEGTGPVAATLTLVYDHHKNRLTEQLTHLQHEHTALVAATTHVHLDHDLCLEVILLRGMAPDLRAFATALKGLKGIQQATLVVAGASHTGHSHDHPHPHSHPHTH